MKYVLLFKISKFTKQEKDIIELLLGMYNPSPCLCGDVMLPADLIRCVSINKAIVTNNIVIPILM